MRDPGTAPASPPGSPSAPAPGPRPAPGSAGALGTFAARLTAGRFTLRPADPGTDTALLRAWAADPEVARWWPELDRPAAEVRRHLAGQLAQGRSTPCVGSLDGVPVSYWELYRADLDPLAGHYPARPHDAGLHLLIGPAAQRGRGLGPRLIRAVTGHQFAADPRARRVLAEPDHRNARSVAAFRRAGFRPAGRIALPGKTAVLMVRERPAPGPREPPGDPPGRSSERPRAHTSICQQPFR
ncbi:GNAT family N-acetyltransferase [Streptomyces zingiberis]|uniref:GNAT family N-acetyltransferase n=1 Tax=Streptomyces zingiberis TaxID=2053010 RepID=UPI0035D41FD2